MRIYSFFSMVLVLCPILCGVMVPSAAAQETLELYTGDVISLAADQIVLDCLSDKRSFVITPETIICIEGFVGESWEDLTNARTVTVSAGHKDPIALRIDNMALVGEMGGLQFQPVLPECSPRATTVEIRGKIIQVLEIQQLLIKAGIDTGPVDGKLGPSTVYAIRTFQQRQGLPETGQISPQLIGQLQAARIRP
ncbi:MAG: peptidoglycan-binding protein [Desulfuromonadaceae bacterium]|nr:peptidoglycan-binding protein [Desulfuromonadaceae bacterium]